MLEWLEQVFCWHSYIFYNVNNAPHKICEHCMLVKKKANGKWETTSYV